MELARRSDGKHVFGLTTPLIATASGAKMGKTAAGAVWLTGDRVSAYDYWQFWRNTEDADVGRFLRLFTDIPLAEIARLEALQGAEINEAKKCSRPRRPLWRTAGRRRTRPPKPRAARSRKARRRRRCRVWSCRRPDAGGGIPAFRLFTLAGLAASNGEARRLIRGGGARLNDELVEDEAALVPEAGLRAGVKLSAGRKHHRLVKVE